MDNTNRSTFINYILEDSREIVLCFFNETLIKQTVNTFRRVCLEITNYANTYKGFIKCAFNDTEVHVWFSPITKPINFVEC